MHDKSKSLVRNLEYIIVDGESDMNGSCSALSTPVPGDNISLLLTRASISEESNLDISLHRR